MERRKKRLESKKSSAKLKDFNQRLKLLSNNDIDMDIINHLVNKRLAPMKKKSDKSKYGLDKKLKYYECLYRLDIVIDACRKNGWTERSHWQDHKVEINNLFKELYYAAKDYSEIRMFYEKLKHEQTARLHKK